MKRSPFLRFFLCGMLACSGVPAVSAAHQNTPLPPLRVSDNGRFLVQADGTPFFWLGDTAWSLFHRLNREEAEHYLRKRAEQGFTVIQAVALSELNGLASPNVYGHVPLRYERPHLPVEDYFRHIDWVIEKADTLGLYVALLPTWGDKWNQAWGNFPEIFTPENAGSFGEWLGRRYAARTNLVWVLGGDRPVENERHVQIIRAMASGLRRGDGGAHLITFHPSGGHGSAEWFHDEPWLDFNMRQNGHALEYTHRYSKTRDDYARKPAKPVIDAEPVYEDHPVAFKAALLGHSTASDVRRALYWDLFDGAFGHTYGHHSVWQMAAPGREPINAPLMSWSEALDQPGAAQMQFGRRLMESRPFLTRVPADGFIVPGAVPTAVPGEGRYRFLATKDENGSYAMVYVPVGGRKFSVRLEQISGPQVRAWWFNPRDGSTKTAGEFANIGPREFASPTPGEDADWILVLDDPSRGFLSPGVTVP